MLKLKKNRIYWLFDTRNCGAHFTKVKLIKNINYFQILVQEMDYDEARIVHSDCLTIYPNSKKIQIIIKKHQELMWEMGYIQQELDDINMSAFYDKE